MAAGRMLEELLARGHEVRLFNRDARDDAKEWPHRVQPVSGDVANEAQVKGAADGCDAVVHITGIVEEKPPEVTFESVNVMGTRNMLTEADRAGVRRFIYVSSLGTDRGESEYHKSKRRAEQIVRGCARPWVILRPGGIYGPGDKNLSMILRMVRSLPAIPVIDRQSVAPVRSNPPTAMARATGSLTAPWARRSSALTPTSFSFSSLE